ncbi:MAG TPA: right-handed parallel beta-helix repeat-containing protein [Prolixibacteraceae bacterium]|nr:right-handed parallel beta-helix repeat-containing protein [Prolixibacteraceae bacterium]
MKREIRLILLLVAFICSYHDAYPQKLFSPEKYYVISDRGRDNNIGTSEASAFRTIQKAADVAQPGDTILVYAGIYRERVKPPRGGTGENARITYKAKPGDHVTITALDPWSPKWSADSNLYYATPPNEIFIDSNYVDGGNPFKLSYMGVKGNCLGQVVVDGVDFIESTTRLDADAASGRWWADQKTGTIYINFGGSPTGRKVEIVTRRGVFRPYLKGLGYITVQGFDLTYCGNNAGDPSVLNKLHPYYQSGLIGTRQGHHWKIIGNKIRKAKGPGLTFSLGTDWDDKDLWDSHGALGGRVQVEVDYAKSNQGDNEMEPGNSQMESRPFKEVGFNLILNNVFDSCGMNAIVGIGSVGNTIYGNRFSNNSYLISGRTAEDGTIKMHMQYGDLIEKNLFEKFLGDHRGVWLDNGVVGTVITRNVFLNHSGRTPTIFFEISSSLDQYLSVVDNNIFINCTHGVVSATADGVAFYNNLFYKCGDGFSMGLNGFRKGETGADYGNMRIHSWNNLFVDQERIFGFAYNQAVNFHTSDFNLAYLPKGVSFGKYLLTDGGTGRGPGGRPNVTTFSLSDITSAKTGGNYWLEKVNWGASNGPNGCEADLGYWKGTMGATIDRHSEERSFLSASNTNRTITLSLGSDPTMKGAPVKKGARISFFGDIITKPKAGPFPDLGKNTKTYTFWDDNKLPPLPALPSAPGKLAVIKQSETTMKVTWINNSPDAKFMYIERRINEGSWQFWGYVTTTQNFMLDYDLLTASNTYEYRIAARNAAGLSSFDYASGNKTK